MFERPQRGERALLVYINFSSSASDENLKEFVELVSSTEAEQVGLIGGSRRFPQAKYFIGTGKAQEIRENVVTANAELVIFNHELSPSQERNLEHLFQCRVIDRTGLILDIFAQRARTHEGKLQVELAQLRYMSTRLVRGWTHLERQKGGIGLRGPGETQLETDRRLIADRIRQLMRRLDKVRRQRDLGRQARKKASVPTVSLVGYTNAGKSTLFNRLTSADVYAADKLFATLDPTLRKLNLNNGSSIILADTVGFIDRLPHELVAAFYATLQETREADLLLHVIDVVEAQSYERVNQVNDVLTKIGADKVPVIHVYNKIDVLDMAPRIEQDESKNIARIWLSSKNGTGIDLLYTLLSQHFSKDVISTCLNLPPHQAKLRARLFELGAVIEEYVDGTGSWQLQVKMSRREFEKIARQEDFAKYALNS